jgi:hypothetical protein
VLDESKPQLDLTSVTFSQTHDKIASDMIRCVHLKAGADGRSHVEYSTIPIGAVQEASAIHFHPGWFSPGLAYCATRAVCDHFVWHT